MVRRFPWRGASLAWLGALLMIGACQDDPIALSVDLVTDLVPGAEFVEVTTELNPGGAGSQQTTRVVKAGEGGFLKGVRVADFGALPSGSTSVAVRVTSKDGQKVAERTARVSISDDYALTLVVSRRCQALVCPSPEGDPRLSTCVGGKCADPACIDGVSNECPKAECLVDADCGEASSCVQSECSKGVCLKLPDDTKCKSGQLCDPKIGCFAPVPACAPTAKSEASCTDGKDDDCDGKVDCADPDCASKSCDDGNACTEGDTCQAGACQPGSPLSCDDDNPCTTDTCDPKKGCAHGPSPDGTTCDDDNVCTDGDTCQSGVCQPGSPLSCDDQNPCTTDTCDPAEGCSSAPNTAPCDDDVFCNGTDTCADGSCSQHAGDTCKDVCNEAKKACVACLTDKDCPTPADQVVSGCTYAACSNTGSKTVKVSTSKCDTATGKCVVTSTNKQVATGCTRSIANGTSCGSGKYCCSNKCVARNDPDHCSSCGIACASGQNCKGIGSGRYTCTCNGTNAQCVNDGFGSDATCYLGVCNCQGNGSPCKGGATCHVISGTNYCAY